MGAEPEHIEQDRDTWLVRMRRQVCHAGLDGLAARVAPSFGRPRFPPGESRWVPLSGYGAPRYCATWRAGDGRPTYSMRARPLIEGAYVAPVLRVPEGPPSTFVPYCGALPAADRLAEALGVQPGGREQLIEAAMTYHWRHAVDGDASAHCHLLTARGGLRSLALMVPPELVALFEEAGAEASIAYTRSSLPEGATLPRRDAFRVVAGWHRHSALRARWRPLRARVSARRLPARPLAPRRPPAALDRVAARVARLLVTRAPRRGPPPRLLAPAVADAVASLTLATHAPPRLAVSAAGHPALTL